MSLVFISFASHFSLMVVNFFFGASSFNFAISSVLRFISLHSASSSLMSRPDFVMSLWITSLHCWSSYMSVSAHFNCLLTTYLSLYMSYLSLTSHLCWLHLLLLLFLCPHGNKEWMACLLVSIPIRSPWRHFVNVVDMMEMLFSSLNSVCVAQFLAWHVYKKLPNWASQLSEWWLMNVCCLLIVDIWSNLAKMYIPISSARSYGFVHEKMLLRRMKVIIVERHVKRRAL